MILKKSLFAGLFFICGLFVPESFAGDDQILLEAVEKYSFCTPYYGVEGYALGVVGDDWALTFEVAEKEFSGTFHAKQAYFYRGANMHHYISKPAGPARPPVPNTKQYSKTRLNGITGNVQRIKVYDKVMGPITITVKDFRTDDQLIHISGRVNILCMGPLP